MEYPLLKALREADFPTEVEGEFITVALAEGGEDTVFEPTLEGLVRALGGKFTEIRDLENLQLKAVHPMEIRPENKYEAVSTNQRKFYYGHGPDMKTALANLYLATKNPTFGL